MRDELEKLIVNAALNGAYEDAGQRVLSTDVISATLTSIINLVDKSLPTKEFEYKDIYGDDPRNNYGYGEERYRDGTNNGYKKAVKDMRAIIRGKE